MAVRVFALHAEQDARQRRPYADLPVPLAVYATLRRLGDASSARGFVAALVLLVVAQFLLFAEIVASATFFGAIALGLAAATARTGERRRIASLVPPIVAAYAVSAVLLLPWVRYMFAFGSPRGEIFSPWHFAIDLASFVVPTSVNELGRVPLFGAIVHHFHAELSETDAYLGLPLLAIIVLFARERWFERGGRLLVHLLVIICVLAMGPWLEIAGRMVLPLPGAALARIPLIDKALPARFMMYGYLVLAMMIAMWLAAREGRSRARWATAAAMVPFMLPNLSASYWTTPAAIPAFFVAGTYRQYVAPGETVMVLPYGILGEGMLWQAITDMYFRMAGGYATFAPAVPAEHSRWPIVAGLYQIAGVPQASEQLKAYLANHNVGAVIVGPRRHYRVGWVDNGLTGTTWLRASTLKSEKQATYALLNSLDDSPLEVGGVAIYRIAPQILASYRRLTALEMEQRAGRARFEALLLAAHNYLARGGDPDSLNPENAAKLGLLPDGWFGGAIFARANPNSAFHARVVLGPSSSDRIAVGLEGWYDSLEPIIRRYGKNASQIYFPYPAVLSRTSAPDGPAMMVMTFERTGLESAVAAIEPSQRMVRSATGRARGRASDLGAHVADEVGAMRRGTGAGPAGGDGSAY